MQINLKVTIQNISICNFRKLQEKNKIQSFSVDEKFLQTLKQSIEQQLNFNIKDIIIKETIISNEMNITLDYIGKVDIKSFYNIDLLTGFIIKEEDGVLKKFKLFIDCNIE